MDSEVVRVHTGSSDVVHDLTDTCRRFVSSYDDGLLHVDVVRIQPAKLVKRIEIKTAG